MSVSFHSTAVIGVKVDDIFTVKREKTQITKYNEDTGKPYKQDVLKERYFWGKTEVEDPDDMEKFVKEMCGLELINSGRAECDLVGIELAKAEPGEVLDVDLDAIHQVTEDVTVKLRDSGDGTALKVKLYLVSYVN